MILAAPDSFKGTHTSVAIAERWARVDLRATRVKPLPLSDGGDGFADFIRYYRPEVIGIDGFVRDPWGRRIVAGWGWDRRRRTAYIESARVIGVGQAPGGPTEATTVGLGQLVRTAAALGNHRLVVGLGGSSTVDGGLGMARALGYRFENRKGGEITAPVELVNVRAIVPPADRVIGPAVSVVAVADVESPLLGMTGAARVFGPQKGAREDEIERLEAGLAALAERWVEDLGADADIASRPRGGSAGGLGAACVALLGARLVGGAAWCARFAGFGPALRVCDAVVTGEGRFDATSGVGKVTGYVVERANRARRPVEVVTGNDEQPPLSLDDLEIAFRRAAENLGF